MASVKFMITHLASCKDRRVHSTMISALKKIGRMGVSRTWLLSGFHQALNLKNATFTNGK
jgi:hypothetical protein